MAIDTTSLQNQIPYYLTSDPARKSFLQELKALSEGSAKGYFKDINLDPYKNERLQGDVWTDLELFSFKNAKRLSVRGIILSNSCDIAPENIRTISPKIIFAPIIKMSSLASRFKENGLPQDRIEARLNAIRRQETTNIFYLPPEIPLDEEHVVLLDDIHSMPSELHNKNPKKIFTLTMAAFYLFIFKLSIHFCRIQENVDRGKNI